MNRAGASGVIGMSAVANATPDGYTLAATSSSTLTVVHLTMPNLQYGNRDFIPIGNYAADAGVIVVRADARWQTFDALIADARKNPGQLTYGSYDVGSLSSLNMEAVKSSYGLQIVNVPFRVPRRRYLRCLGSRSTSVSRPTAPLRRFSGTAVSAR